VLLSPGERPITRSRPSPAPDWSALTEKYIHPAKIFIFEAIEWIGEPLSPRELDRLSDGAFGLIGLAYHLRELAKAGLVALTDETETGGAREHFYFLVAD
jgi:hypothetical protein